MNEYLETVSHREHLIWMAYLENEWNPDLLHWYLMRIAQRIIEVNSKSGTIVKAEDQRVEFEWSREVRWINPEDLTPQELAELVRRQKARWKRV